MNIKFLKNFIKIIAICTLLAVFLFIVLIIVFVIVLLKFAEPSIIKNLNDYDTCLNSVYYKSYVSHFPKSIPVEAQEAVLYCIPGEYQYDGALVLLKLKINKDYIQNELKTHLFLNVQTPLGTSQELYNMPSQCVNIDNKDLTYYVLDNGDNKYFYKEFFPYFTGIGVDKDLNYILYYYIRPD